MPIHLLECQPQAQAQPKEVDFLSEVNMSEQQAPYKIEGRPATIFRVIHDKNNPYVMIDRRIIDNKDLSFKAKGILTYLLSRPDGWEVNLVDLANRGTEGLSAIKSGVKELKDAGYIKHSRIRSATGKLGTVIWEVYEAPQVGNQLMDTPQVGVSPQVEKPQVEKPQVDNRTQVLSTLSNKELSNKKEEKKAKPNFDDMTVNEAMKISEIKLYHQTTGIFPGNGQWETIWETIRDMRAQGKPVTVDRLKPFWKEWRALGYRTDNLNWLRDWAVSGKIPERPTRGKPQSNKSEPEYRTLNYE
jgi:hypothetical protein